MEKIVFVLLLIAIIVVYLMVDVIRKRRRVERVFFARGYIFVRVKMVDSTIHKGFIQKGLLRMLNHESNSFKVVLESYKTGATSTINTNSIASVEVLRPLELRTSRNPFSAKFNKARTNPHGKK